MKTLSCQDVSNLACPFVAKGETEEEMIQQLKDHALTAHPEESAKMMEGKSEEEMNEMLKSKVKEEVEATETGATETKTAEEAGTTEPAAETAAPEETNPTM